MNNHELQLLTSSRLACARSCQRKHYYRYELGLSRIRSADALRFGAAFHRGLESRNKGADEATAITQASAGYEQVPQWADPVEWAVERETLRSLLAGHFWRYSEDNLQFVAVEQSFQTPLLNPGSGHPSRLFLAAGKIDGIVKLADGRLAVLEYKTAGEEIGPDSEYWLRLRCDPQISMYILGARAMGFDVSTVLYDVTRKPTISPKLIPTLDDQGRKIVLDANGKRVFKKDGTPRESASTADGFVLQQKTESPEQYGERVLADIGERPDHYFSRREVPRLEEELAEFRLELWQQAQQLRDAQRSDRWFRNVGKMTCSYCSFSSLCLNSIQVNPDAPPAGYEVLADVHPELSTGGDASQGD